MLVLWIVVAVVVALLVVGLLVFLPRRARRGAAPSAPEVQTEAPPAPPGAPPRRAEAPAGEAPGPLQAPLPPEAAEPDVVAPAPTEAPAGPPELRERLGKTRGLLSGYVRALRARSSVDEQTWDELEEGLLRADVGVATTSALLAELRDRVHSGELRGPDAVVDALRADLRQELDTDGNRNLAVAPDATTVWLFVGVNGVGKTTTIGKVARRESAAGRSVVLAAGDTFRAAAGEQLERWAERIGVNIVRGAEGGDPSAVVFDAVQRASARGNELVLADTAGRLHTKVNLIEELKKIRRVADRPPGQVTEVLLVLDATTGQNGLTQARQFLDAVGVTGVVLTKLDGTAKGGIVVAIQRELGLPVKLVGVGEGPDDLVAFDPDGFVDALFE
ncbi:MAG TPA: signal recognition particle-docking protein FtsY [Acidimicrobiales bacterium]|nr:signal recognition particle-docking protein FtsY [Acidimicrobiales bacterium]